MTQNSFSEIFNQFSKLKVLIIGDIMIDAYDWGKVERISPEAPVPIISLNNRENRLGGAANVALNIQALGATPILCAVVGNDLNAKVLKDLLVDQKMTDEGIVTDPNRVTTVKTRIIAGHQHLMRVDHENDEVVNDQITTLLCDKISKLLQSVDVVIFEDYDKGVISERLIKYTVDLAQKLQKPVVVDPKKRNFNSYQNVTLFKPNLKELKEGLKIELKNVNKQSLDEAVAILHKTLQAKSYFITLSEKGVYYSNNQESFILPAHHREIADVSGAGDTVISTTSLLVALGLAPKLIAALSNLSGGLVCEHVGVMPIDKEKLLEETIKINQGEDQYSENNINTNF